MRTLSELAAAAGAELRGEGAIDVTGIVLDSREVRGGEIFVAFAGTTADGADFLEEAARSGAAAVCMEPFDAARQTTDLPLLVVPDARAAAADLAAAFHDHPARRLHLLGVTGTLGKTSTALFLQAAMATSRRRVGVVGSLGASVAGGDGAGAPELDLDGMTTPDAPTLHRAFQALLDAGVEVAAMEVTSHALAQERVRGLEYELGVVTNLVPDEHLDFHESPEEYLAIKTRFFDHLRPGAPLVVNADDSLVCDVVRNHPALVGHPIIGVGAGAEPDLTAVRIANVRLGERGTRVDLEITGALPRLTGPPGESLALSFSLPLIGVQHCINAALAATAALIAGATPEEVTNGLAAVAPVHRRMEVVRAANPCIIDDTTGNPESLAAVFRTIADIPRGGLRVAFGLRGSRGMEINTRLAEALAKLVIERAAAEPVQLVVTWCEDEAGERDRVTADERSAAMSVFEERLADGPGGLQFQATPTLAAAIRHLLAGARSDDLVLLLGTQAMDRAAELALAVISPPNVKHP